MAEAQGFEEPDFALDVRAQRVTLGGERDVRRCGDDDEPEEVAAVERQPRRRLMELVVRVGAAWRDDGPEAAADLL